MASTLARTGRSMKNLEIMPSAPAVRRRLRRLRGLHLRVDLVARDGAQEAGDDHPVVGRDAVLDRAQRLDALADLDLALLNHVVLVDDQEIAPALVGAE